MTGFAVVTVIHNSEAELRGLLDSLERELDPLPRIVVVDSGSSDGGPALARERGAELVELGGNLGFGAANNAGIARVSEPVTVLLNPDVELLDDSLARLAELAAGREALFVPRLLNADGSVQDSAHPVPGTIEGLVPALMPRPLLPPPLRRRYEPWRSETERELGWAIAACVAARTDLLRRLGPFDPSAFLFYEDMELCLRARREGVPTVLEPDIRLRHLGGTSTERALGSLALDLHARRRREVMATQGRRARALDDLAELLTHGLRAAGRSLLRRDPEPARRRLRALLRARRG
ncbi:MAG: N-acetylglucosaminyl-diphospho-decaprenol L-rhamnosyltransferase [Thermoleophilaceae bacterium]|nr:N-acetylglucosaminyl-diphospho-decaprenol L-rhamnosyltransferase [Thermoleophilaceae bacterium]